jgi:hypothetical protein
MFRWILRKMKIVSEKSYTENKNKHFMFFFFFCLSVGLAESRRMHCSLPRPIVIFPLLVPPFISRGAPRQTA